MQNERQQHSEERPCDEEAGLGLAALRPRGRTEQNAEEVHQSDVAHHTVERSERPQGEQRKDPAKQKARQQQGPHPFHRTDQSLLHGGGGTLLAALGQGTGCGGHRPRACLHYGSEGRRALPDQGRHMPGGSGHQLMGVLGEVDHILAGLDKFVLQGPHHTVLADAVVRQVPLVLCQLSPTSNVAVDFVDLFEQLHQSSGPSFQFLVLAKHLDVFLRNLREYVVRRVHPHENIGDGLPGQLPAPGPRITIGPESGDVSLSLVGGSPHRILRYCGAQGHRQFRGHDRHLRGSGPTTSSGGD
mmetsp:Transcript_33558/g.96225  ORF Transcript_33558/g.96225 Transcript_33558/m.96225 type:complete len:300 (+) Transcript_33558:352-1251(+)